MPRLKYRVTLTKEEREELEQIVWKGNHRSRKVVNALILLNSDRGDYATNNEADNKVASILTVSETRIQNTKKRFVEGGLEIALEGQPKERTYQKKIDGNVEAHLVALSCSTPPKGRCRWSLRLLADQAVELKYVDSISHEAIRRVLKKTNLSHGKKWVG